MKPPLITAHRGASHDAPENTLAALRLGFSQGADAGECDVRLTRDGEIVLMHDATTRRTAGRSLVVAAATLAELRTLDVGVWKGAAWAGERAPTLAETLAATPHRRRLLIEVKCGAEILEPLARVLAQAARPPGDLVLMGFDRDLAERMKRRFPQVETHWIVERCRRTATDLAATARAAGLDGLNLDRRFPLDETFVAAIHAAGLALHVWTLDDVEQARALAAAGVDSITTNRPGWLREQLAGAGEAAKSRLPRPR